MAQNFWQYTNNVRDLKDEIEELNLDIKYSDDVSNLFQKTVLKINNQSSKTYTIPNRLIIQPMEGCDGTPDGKPTELTKRRYERFGSSGAGLIWFEATAVTPNGRANPRQLTMSEENISGLKELITISNNSRNKMLEDNSDLPIEIFKDPVNIIQLTHSGRYSRPNDKKNPYRAYKYDILDESFHISPNDGCIVDDDFLDDLKKKYMSAIACAKKAGFHGVGIKSCHRYLISELLSGFTRKDSKYGGPSFENRSKFLMDIINEAIKKFPDMIISLRLNLYDGIKYPYGFGVEKTSKSIPPEPDTSEPIMLVKLLQKAGVNLLNTSVGNPYYKPHISRPYDFPSIGTANVKEMPIKSIERVIKIERKIKKAVPEMTTIGTSFSWFRQATSYVAAAEIQNGSFDLIGLGRMAFANPEFPIQIFRNKEINPVKSCMACSKCTDLMRFDVQSGCPIRDARKYGRLYSKTKRAFLKNNK